MPSLQDKYFQKSLEELEKPFYKKPSFILPFIIAFLSLGVAFASLLVSVGVIRTNENLVIDNEKKKNAVTELSTKDKEIVEAEQKANPREEDFDDSKVSQSGKRLNTASEALNSSVTGWIFIGKATNGEWVNSSQLTIEPITRSQLDGAEVIIKTDIYIRADTAKTKKSDEKVIGVVSAGVSYKVIDVFKSKAKKPENSFYIWVKIKKTTEK